MKIKNFKYISIALCITTSIMLLKNTNFLEVLSSSNPLRILLEKSKTQYLCDKAGSRLTEKYKTAFQEEDIETKALSKSQQAIIDFARHSSYNNIKPFIKSIGIFIFFLVLAVIFIFLWISYCSCCCCSCCLFSKSKPSRFCSFIFYLISAISNLLVIIFSIAVLAMISSFFKRLNGTTCSAVYFLDHIRYGLAPSYTNRVHEWEGLERLVDKLENTQNEMNGLTKESEQLYTNADGKKGQYVGDKCENDYNVLLKNIEIIKNLINESFDEVSSIDGINDVRDALKNFNDADKDIGDDLYDSMHDYTNKIAKRISKAIFSLTLIIGILGLATLTLYACFGFGFARIAYIVIWNISMLLMIVTLIESAGFGILGYFFRDAVQVTTYIISEKNFKSKDPLVFDSSDGYITDLIEVCANGNGSFTDVLDGGNILNEKLRDWKNNRKTYEEARNKISCDAEEKTKALKGYYDQLLNIIDESLDLSYNLTNVSCLFARNDKNILLNEIDSSGKKGIALSGLGFMVGILLGISVLAGIIYVHKYSIGVKKDEKKMQIPGMNESSSDIDKENNNNTLPNTMK